MRLKDRLAGLVTRWYLARAQRKGFDLSKMAMLPDSALMSLRRDGLDPVPELGEVRAREPVSRVDIPFGVNVWLVSGYEEAKAVLGNAGAYSNDFANLVGKGASETHSPGGLGFADPPEHTRLRKLLTPEFTMRRLSRLTPGITDIIEQRLDAMAAVDGPVDLVEEFALPIPSLVICDLLGVPYEDRGDFQRLSMARFDLFGGATASLGAISESLDYLRDVVKKQRDHPGDGLLGMIIQEHGDQVDDNELAGLADGVLTGGFETTASMLALGALVLLQDKESFQLVHDDDAAIHNFVEELLRYLTVVQVAFPRFAREDLVVAGKQISAGDVVIVSLAGADRDPKLGSDLETVVPTRAATSHLAFGYGVHRCIGAELARMELRAAYPALVRRFPNLRLADEDLNYRRASIVYGLDRLPVLLD
ncbi:cytochrome [Actinophytocola xinjiangensis]|uniref:Cytochrome n=1 Tax=Actinophytocola xinjiangensis TaxID=485602 RepID=A0A7Z1AWE0_9PSEU|nr:cytochrome P450 [Actinophytocola xinjiangensis]OLF07840.1 cytochrome [Actinophytocola xinjiangensis]